MAITDPASPINECFHINRMTRISSIGPAFGKMGTVLAMMCCFAWGGISQTAEKATNETMKIRSILILPSQRPAPQKQYPSN